MDIHAKISAIESFKSTLNSTYSSMKQLGEFQKHEIAEWRGKISEYCQSLDGIISEFVSIASEARDLANEFRMKMEYYRNQAQAIYDSGHWVYDYDDDGKVTGKTYVYDVAAYNAALAMAEKYQEKYRLAQNLVTKVENDIEILQSAKQALVSALSEITSKQERYNAGCLFISETGTKNIGKLSRVIESLQRYAASTPFSKPSTISFPTSFSTGGGSSSYRRSTYSPSMWTYVPTCSPVSSSSLGTGSGGGESNAGGLGAGSSVGAGAVSSPMSKPQRVIYDENAFKHMESQKKTQKSYEIRAMEDAKKIESGDIAYRYTKDATAHSSSAEINKVLTTSLDESGMSKEHYDVVREKADILSKDIDKMRIPNAITVFRGQSIDQIMDAVGCRDYDSQTPEELQQNLVGKCYRYRGFTSTSVLPSVAEKYSDKFGGVFLEIEAPAGTRAFYAGGVSEWGNNISKESREAEIILQADTEYEIQDIRKGRDKYYMKVRIVSQKTISNENEVK